jgi:hypothetical protein
MLTSNQNRVTNLHNPPELTARDMIPRQNRPRPEKQHGGGMNPWHVCQLSLMVKHNALVYKQSVE